MFRISSDRPTKGEAGGESKAALRAGLLLPLVVACTSGQPDGGASSIDPDAWPRCYVLRTGDWTPSSGQRLDITHAPPPIIQLDTQQVGGVEQKRHRLAPQIPELSQRGSLAPSWTPLAPDSLQFLWSSGHEGVVVTVAVRGDSVNGSARTFTDYGSRALAPVTGWRSPCSPQLSSRALDRP
jgi:hypothetical protein